MLILCIVVYVDVSTYYILMSWWKLCRHVDILYINVIVYCGARGVCRYVEVYGVYCILYSVPRIWYTVYCVLM